jgi:hypothetical protein
MTAQQHIYMRACVRACVRACTYIHTICN